MSDPIKEMEKAGWIKVYVASEEYSPDTEVLTFHKPRQKPNAIVDWEKLEKLKTEWTCGAIEIACTAIKKIEP